ncbi:MAG: ribosomal protein S18-alanine N-acetyltransferase [Undibacterium sp.]|jgi:ribosomal-protein-alanine N-acetyltransferase|nr:ribosomal protein S18-alanine N-acetyltransferase [Undibacterium sp.]
MSDYTFCQLGFADVDEILAVEEQVYSHPWTRGNFLDSMYSGHAVYGLRNKLQNLSGYFILMPVVDEMHLLNLAVAADFQRQGIARILLDKMNAYAVEQNVSSILLEVRLSNQRAIDVYQRYGFVEIGRRKAYYPAIDSAREDAIVMRKELCCP